MWSSTLQELTRAQVNFQVRALVGREIAQAPIEDRFRGGDKLKTDRLPGGEMSLGGRDDGR